MSIFSIVVFCGRSRKYTAGECRTTVWHLPTNRERELGILWTIIYDIYQHKNTPSQSPDNISTTTHSLSAKCWTILYAGYSQKSKILTKFLFSFLRFTKSKTSKLTPTFFLPFYYYAYLIFVLRDMLFSASAEVHQVDK